MTKTATRAVKETKLSPNAFIGKASAPNERELAAALGESMSLWRDLVAELKKLGANLPEWHCYSPKAGWSLRVKKGDRNIVYVSPCHGSFRASFALGDKALKQALASGLPADVVQIIKTAKKYAEGTAVRIEIRAPKDVATVCSLAVAKIQN